MHRQRRGLRHVSLDRGLPSQTISAALLALLAVCPLNAHSNSISQVMASEKVSGIAVRQSLPFQCGGLGRMYYSARVPLLAARIAGSASSVPKDFYSGVMIFIRSASETTVPAIIAGTSELYTPSVITTDVTNDDAAALAQDLLAATSYHLLLKPLRNLNLATTIRYCTTCCYIACWYFEHTLLHLLRTCKDEIQHGRAGGLAGGQRKGHGCGYTQVEWSGVEPLAPV